VSRACKGDPFKPDDALPVYTPEQLDRMDRKFCAAMLDAISSGAERCPIGVCSTPGTKRPRIVLKALPSTVKTNLEGFE
jgi:hypothetical protein